MLICELPHIPATTVGLDGRDSKVGRTADAERGICHLRRFLPALIYHPKVRVALAPRLASDLAMPWIDRETEMLILHLRRGLSLVIACLQGSKPYLFQILGVEDQVLSVIY